MPELPEVETSRRGIAPWVEQQEVRDVIVPFIHAAIAGELTPREALEAALEKLLADDRLTRP